MTEGIAYAFSINSINVFHRWLGFGGGICDRDHLVENVNRTGTSGGFGCMAILAP